MAALYQRARPTTFAEVVGQDHVKEVLASAIQQGRTSHAYLFSGPRGVGKTTMARLLAMAVNCEKEPAERPCGDCESCRLVQAGSHPDVMELDAASHNSVDDIRDLRERVGLASLRGGKRVWILDEAHMLTKSAANALLKTLEEPPPGLVFVLATTEPERLPPTILSRCQHFRFRRLTDEQIASKLVRLASEAGVESEPAAIDLVARTADGGMRDAESLLERLLVAGEKVTLARAEETLGLPPHEQLEALAGALAEDDLNAMLDGAAQLYRDGFAPRTVAEQLARHLRDLMHVRLSAAPQARREAADRAAGQPSEGAGLGVDELLVALHALDDEQERFVRNNDLYALEVALIKTRNALVGNVPASSAPAAGAALAPTAAATMAAARPSGAAAPVQAPATQRPAGRAEQPATQAAGGSAEPATPAFEPNRRPTRPAPAASGASDPPPQAAASGAAEASGSGRRSFSWHSIRGKASPQLKAFLMPAAASMEDDVVRLVYQDTHAFHHSQLLSRQGELEALLQSELSPSVRLIIEGPGGVRTGGAGGTSAAGGDGPKA